MAHTYNAGVAFSWRHLGIELVMKLEFRRSGPNAVQLKGPTLQPRNPNTENAKA
jgi:hypothetical protein